MKHLKLVAMLLAVAGVPLAPCDMRAGTSLITADDNAFVFKNDPAADQNESEQLMVKSNGNNSYSRLAYMRFDISSINANDTVFLDLNVEDVGTGGIEALYVWSLDDGVAGETTWDSSLTFNTRPDGTGDLPTADVAEVGYHGYVTTGVISVSLDAATLQALLSADSNDELTLALGNNAAHLTIQTRLSAVGNSGGHIEPRLRVLAGATTTSIVESTYGGALTEVSETTYSFNQSNAQAKVGEGGTGNNSEYIHMLLFELPERPEGSGFQAEDTSITMTISSEDVVTVDEHADMWAIGYVPAEDIGDVGSNLNDGGATDIDDFWLSEADSETKTGWNIGSDNTEKMWDNMAALYSSNALASPPAVNTNLASFINDLYVNHGASQGDYLVLRVNYDVDMTDYDDWIFRTGSSATDKPLLTLTLAETRGTVFVFN